MFIGLRFTVVFDVLALLLVHYRCAAKHLTELLFYEELQRNECKLDWSTWNTASIPYQNGLITVIRNPEEWGKLKIN